MISAPAVIASDQRFEFFGTAAAAARSEDRQAVRLRWVVAELFRVPPLGNACKRSRRPTQKSRDVAAMINIAARKQVNVEGSPVTGLVRSVMEVQSSNPRRWLITVIATNIAA